MARSGRKPNFLLITCDQWRGECLSAAGHPTVKTPNADALAAEGVMFVRHYAGAAPCAPARACLYTGLYQMTNRVCRNGTPLDTRHGNIASFTRRLGYDPTLFGYTDTGPDPRQLAPRDPLLASYEGVLPGFTARQLLPEHQKQWLSWLAARGIDASAGSPDIHRATHHAGKITSAPPIYSKDETPAAFLAGEFIRWLSEQDPGAPWFAHISFISPHPPFVVPAPYNTMYDPQDGPHFRQATTKGAEREIHPFVDYEISHRRVGDFVVDAKGKIAGLSEAEFRQIRATYCGMISEVDAQLGRALGRREEPRRLGRHDHRPHLGPCRDDGRPSHAGKGRLLRRQLPHPADHPRPAPTQGRRPQGRRHSRKPSTSCPLSSICSAATSRRISTDTRWRRFSTA